MLRSVKKIFNVHLKTDRKSASLTTRCWTLKSNKRKEETEKLMFQFYAVVTVAIACIVFHIYLFIKE